MARDTHHPCDRPSRLMACAIATLGLLLVSVYSSRAHSPRAEPQEDVGAEARRGVVHSRATPSGDVGRTGRAVAPPAARGVTVVPAPVTCPAEEVTALNTLVSLYMHWHLLRHAQWHADEVVDPLLEALATEEAGQAGTAQGRGPIFRSMLAVLQAADPAQATRIQAGTSARAVLDTLRAGAAARAQDVTRLAAHFRPYLACLRQHRVALEALTALNQMPHVPQPVVDPEGELGPFIGAYMRHHLLVDHAKLIRSTVTAALLAHQTLQPMAQLMPTVAASVRLLEQTLARLDPALAAEVRQDHGAQALQGLREGEAAFLQRQASAVQAYQISYRLLPRAAQDALAALAPPRAAVPASAPSLQAPEPRGTGAATSSPVETQLALVIGNGSYTVAPLRNPLHDARAIAQSLREVGFAVVERENLTKRAMEDEIRAFGTRLSAGGVGLFYFAGHGVQVGGANYLLPIGSTIEKEQDVVYEAVDAGRVVSEMEAAANALNIVILDACRNNPLPRSVRTAVHGLAAMNAPSGTLIAYATAPGSVAHDGEGFHGLYTQELLQHMRLPGVKLEDLLKRVRVAVKAKSQGQQIPWETSALEGDFFFVPPYPPEPVARPERPGVAGDAPVAAVAVATATIPHAPAPAAEAPDHPQAVPPAPVQAEPEDSRGDSATRPPPPPMAAPASVTPLVLPLASGPGGTGPDDTPPSEALARPPKREPPQRPSSQRPRARKIAQAAGREAPQAPHPTTSAATPHVQPGSAGWQIITK